MGMTGIPQPKEEASIFFLILFFFCATKREKKVPPALLEKHGLPEEYGAASVQHGDIHRSGFV
ncbi:hypothetical protein ACSS6W_002523 [Trichoderma asperelloides]